MFSKVGRAIIVVRRCRTVNGNRKMPTSSAIAQGFEDEIKARLAPPAGAGISGPLGVLHNAIFEASRSMQVLSPPLHMARVPWLLRPLARLAARMARLIMLPYLSRQQDFNHNVLVALEQVALELARTTPR